VKDSHFLSVKVLIWLTFLTQAVTMLLFYLYPDNYAFHRHRPFYFTGLESFPVFFDVGIFLIVFISVASFFGRLFKTSNQQKSEINSQQRFLLSAQEMLTKRSNSPTPRVRKSTSIVSTGFIILIVVLMIPLNIWMFKMGIGLTGAPPPRLPYKLSGILTYFAKLVVPFLLNFLYLRTRRQSLLLMMILGLYSAVAGLSTISRGTLLLILLGPLTFAFLDRRWILFSLAAVFMSINLSLVNTSRSLVMIVQQGISGSDTSLGLINTFWESLANIKWNFVWLSIPTIVGRFESFQHLWLASNVNPASMGGGWAILTKVIDWKLIDLGHNAVHLEVLGYTVPEGYYNVSAGLLAYLLWAVGESRFFHLPFATLAALFLILQEISLRSIWNLYTINTLLLNPLVVLLSLAYIVSPGMNVVNVVFIIIFIFARLPRLSIIKRFFMSIGLCDTGSLAGGATESSHRGHWSASR
jgi:hypothetical protein